MVERVTNPGRTAPDIRSNPPENPGDTHSHPDRVRPTDDR
jgi:hypothetical protein